MSNVALEPDAEEGVSIHAGFPNPAADRRLHSLDLNQLLVRHPTSTFIFRIRGEQGTAYGILDGDLAVVDRMADTEHSYDLVLWHDGRQFKLSRPSRMDASGTIWGSVTAVIRQYRQASSEA